MKKLFSVDLKRLLQNKTAIILAIAAPLVLVMFISVAVAPYFFADVRAQNFTVAVYSEDDDPVTASILKSLIESRSLRGLIAAEFVDSEQEGLRKVKQGAAAFIHIPKNMQSVLREGGSATISYFGNDNMPLEDALLFETLSSGVELVSHAQHAVNVLYYGSLNHGAEWEAAAREYSRISGIYFTSVLSRAALYEDTDLTSPLAGALPIEYYAVSFLILFVALGGMPIARMTADDSQAGLIHRQLLSGNTPAKCFVSRWLAGGVFLFIQYAILTAAFLIITGAVSAFSGNVLTLIVFGALLCAFVSMGMMLAGLYSRTAPFAVRIAFMSVLGFSLLGGLIIPSAYMPSVIRDISYYTPFAAALKLGISGMFDGAAGGIFMFAAVFIVYLSVLLPVSIKSFQRRTS